MSTRSKKEPATKPKRQREKAAPTQEKHEAPAPKEVPKPKGEPPRAIVSSRHNGGMVEREARGFSLGELGGAGLTTGDAGRWSLATDVRRRTVLEKNVESLKSWFSPAKAAPTPRPAPEEQETEQPAKPKKRAPAKKAAKRK